MLPHYPFAFVALLARAGLCGAYPVASSVRCASSKSATGYAPHSLGGGVYDMENIEVEDRYAAIAFIGVD